MTAPHEVSPHPPSETPRPPQPTASFAPGPGFVVALVVIVLIVVLALVGYFFPRESDLLSGAVDTLKLIVTTALGFVFARTLDHDK